MTENRCQCGRPSRDACICTDCAHILDAAIAEVCELRGLAYDLEVALSRQDRIDRPGGNRQQVEGDDGRQWPGTLRPTANPFDQRTSVVARNLKGILSRWAHLVAKEQGVYADSNRRGIGPVCRRCVHPSCRAIPAIPKPPDDLAGLATWLRPRVGWLRRHVAGGEAYTEILDAVKQARHVIDRPAERLYAGPCDQCEGDLYARPGALIVECHECQLVYEVESRRSWLLKALDDHLVNATQMSRLVSYLGVRLAPSTIRMYVNKGRIVAHGSDPNGHPLYRLGDVVRTYYSAGHKVSEPVK